MNRIEMLTEEGTMQTWLAEQLGKNYYMNLICKTDSNYELKCFISEILGINVKKIFIGN